MNPIQISEIQVIPVKPKNGLVAFVSFVINQSLYVSSVAVYTRLDYPDQYRLVYPSKLVGNKDISILYPINKDVGVYIQNEVSKELNKINKKCDEYARYSDFNSQRDRL